MTDQTSSQEQAKVALPPLPYYFDDFTDRTRDEIYEYTTAAIAQDRAARAQAEPVPLSCRDSHEASLKYVEGWEAAKADSAARAQGAGEADSEPDDKPDPERQKMERDADSWRTLMAALGFHKRVELTCECTTAPRVLVPRYAYEVTVGPVTARNRATPDAALRAALQSASEGRSV